MKTVLNIIHPYSYRLQGETFSIGPIKKYEERDAKISETIKKFLEAGARVLHHRAHEVPISEEITEREMNGLMIESSFQMDPFFNILFDKRITSILTLRQGLPIPNTRPENVSENGWKYISERYASYAEVKRLFGNYENAFFIGGQLENCMTSFMVWANDNIRANGQRFYYIPQLCASTDAIYRTKMETEFQKRNILPINVKEAEKLIL